MELTTAEVRIGGDLRNIMVRGALRPVTVPELEVLKVVHGDDAVRQLEVCGHVERSSKEEKARLVRRYGASVVELVYPGINGNGMDMGDTPEPAPKKKRPSRAKKATTSEPEKEEAQQELL